MKKVTLILSALALVLGLSQCKKQEEPVQSGEKQHIVLTANNGNDGSKVAASFASAALNLTWEGNETITVSGGASGTLTYKSGAGTPNATFEGDITIDRGGDIVFTIGSAPSSYANQTGTAEGCATWIKENNHFVGTSSYQPSGSYEVQMKLQYAVLKLDVSALGTSGLLTIAAGEETVASVTDVSEIASAVFVAVPADGTEKTYSIEVNSYGAVKTWELEANTFYTKQGTTDGSAIVIVPVYVDLGLSVKWATCNVGANSPEEYGDYFAWGETETKTDYSWETYKYGSVGNLTKYNTDSGYGTVDGKTVLEPEDDAAHANWGDGWRMPTVAEWQELCDNTTSTWTTLNGVEGRLFTSVVSGYTGVSLFLPAAGFFDGTFLYSEGSYDYYWSSSLDSDFPPGAYCMSFDSDFDYPPSGSYRRYGLSVRPVR